MQEDQRPWLTATYTTEQKKFYFEHRDDYKDVSTAEIYKDIYLDDIRGRIIKETLDKRHHPEGISTEEKENMPSRYYEPDGCPWCGADLTEEDGTYRCYCCGYDHILERNDYVWTEDEDD